MNVIKSTYSGKFNYEEESKSCFFCKIYLYRVTELHLVEEVWKTIFMDGEETYLQVSNWGRLRSMFTGFPKIRKTTICQEYEKVTLQFNYKRKPFRFHRLVAMYFIENNEYLPEVNHLDGVKHNNHISNLEWCTKDKNMQHAVKSGLYKIRGFSNKNGISILKIKNDEIDKEYTSYHQLNKEFPTTSVIRAIQSGKEYKGFKWALKNDSN